MNWTLSWLLSSESDRLGPLLKNKTTLRKMLLFMLILLCCGGFALTFPIDWVFCGDAEALSCAIVVGQFSFTAVMLCGVKFLFKHEMVPHFGQFLFDQTISVCLFFFNPNPTLANCYWLLCPSLFCSVRPNLCSHYNSVFIATVVQK